ncbi:LAQU0S02e11078g1_1 [Lachancea quebecensis]|uniref:LAQU0S02e11078g1_1 n=1 Tax=Lachancea quebecensis TaxID=1654605 RepID=A0A0P1KR58_9SACH|nr:LAQU0S02e11078g1_1 [Lachancea quebecensis]
MRIQTSFCIGLLFAIATSSASLLEGLGQLTPKKASLLKWDFDFNRLANNFGRSVGDTHFLTVTETVVRNAERQMLNLFIQNPAVGIAEEVNSLCREIESASARLMNSLERPAWKPARQQVTQYLEGRANEFSLRLASQIKGDARSPSKGLVNLLTKFSKSLQSAVLLVESPSDLSDAPEEFTFANHVDDLTVGRIIGEGIAEKIRDKVAGGDTHAALTDIANIFCDFGTLMTAYLTGLAICSTGLGVALCGVSIVICGGGTIIYICRLLQSLQKVFKTLGGEF